MTSRPSKAALLHSALRGLTTQYVAALVNGIVQIGVLALLARLLTPADYGLVGLANVFTALGGLLAQFGVGVAVVRIPVLTDREIRAAFTLSLVLGLALAGLTLVFAPWVALLFHAPALTPILRVLCLTFPFVNLGTVAEALLDRHLAWGRAMWVNLSSFVLGYAATGVTLALLGLGAWALVGCQLAQVFLRSILLLRAQPHAKRLLWDRREIGELVRFGRGLTLARLFNYGASQGDYLAVGRALGVSPLGFYTRSFKLMMLPVNYFAVLVTKVLFPIMARLQHEREKLAVTYLAGSTVISVVSGPLSALMVVLAPELVDLLLGPRWAPAVAPLQVLSLGILFRNGFLMAYCLDGALGDMGKRIVRDGVYAAVVVVGSALAVRFGLTGVAAAVLLAVAIHYAVAAAMSRHLLGFSWSEYWHSQWPGLVLAALVVLVGVPIRHAIRQAGGPTWVVFGGTLVAASVAVLLPVIIHPQLTGRYGLLVMRSAADALSSRLPKRAVVWLRQAA